MPNKVFIISEIGVNHNGDMALAKEMIEKSAECGADAVKFQSFKAENLVTRSALQADYQADNMKQEKSSQFEMLKKLELSEQDHFDLKEHAERCGVEFMSSPFDDESLALLVSLGVKRIKIASGEGQNGPLLLKIGQTGLPCILSTGMGTLETIEQALKILSFGYANEQSLEPSLKNFDDFYETEAAKKALEKSVSILHCTTNYPAALDEINLNAMETIQKKFNLPIGYSDHSEGDFVTIASVAVGAKIIEKHFTTDRTLGGPDHKASLEPKEFKKMVSDIRVLESKPEEFQKMILDEYVLKKIMGSYDKILSPSEVKNKKIACKAIVASRAIKKGDMISEDNITTKRVSGENGFSANEYWDILGRIVQSNIQADVLITNNVLEKN